MKYLPFILILLISFPSCMGQSKLETELEITLPDDLKNVWKDSKWDKSNNVFTLYNYKPFYLLDPHNQEEIVDQSLRLNYEFRRTKTGLSKSIVLATSFLKDDGQFLFYGFDQNARNMGIWAWHLDKGPLFPSKIGDNLEEIFGSMELLSKGFDDSKLIENTGIRAYQGKMNESDFTYGNFPKKDLKEIAEEICPDILYFVNEVTFLVSEEKIIEIDKFYSTLGRQGLLNEMKEVHLHAFLQKVNMESWNQSDDKRVFIIQFYGSPVYGLCHCNRSQAKELNRLGFFSFYNYEDMNQSSNFILGQ